MKKTLLALALTSLLFTGCSSNDDNETTPVQTNPVSIQYFHPPTWTQGTWTSGSGSALLGFRFSNDDVVLVSNTTELSYKTTFNQYNSVSVGTCKATETTTNDVYDVNMLIGSQTQVYKFKKISNTRIQWVNSPNGLTYLDKQ